MGQAQAAWQQGAAAGEQGADACSPQLRGLATAVGTLFQHFRGLVILVQAEIDAMIDASAGGGEAVSLAASRQRVEQLASALQDLAQALKGVAWDTQRCMAAVLKVQHRFELKCKVMGCSVLS